MFLKSSILKEKLNEILYQKYLKAINNYEEFDEELLINYINSLCLYWLFCKMITMVSISECYSKNYR